MAEQSKNAGSEGDAEVKSREEKAARVYCKACEESGLKVSSWEDFAAWKDFVAGNITEQELVEKAREEMDQFSKRFGKYLIMQKEPEPAREKEEKKDRVKRANKIYKGVCEEADISVCFFSNFSAWQDFVEGRIDEEEFQEKARIEMEKSLL